MDNIQSIQASITQDSDRMDEDDAQIRPLLNQVLADNGYKTYDELRDKVLEDFTEEERKEYLDTMAQFDELNEDLGLAFDITNGVLFIAGVAYVGSSLKVLTASGAMYHNMRSMFVVMKLLYRGQISVEVAAKTFKLLSGVSKNIATKFTGATKLGKALKVVRVASETLVVLGLITDAVIIIWQALESAKQKKELQKAIRDLFETRLGIKMTETLAKDTSYYQATLKSIIRTMARDMPEERKQQRIEEDIEYLLEDIETLWSKNSYETIFDLLQRQDANAGAWTNEDPGRKETIAKMDSVDDIVTGNGN